VIPSPAPSVSWRPGYFVITRFLQRLASGHEHEFYKTLQIVLLVSASLIFIGFLNVTTWWDFAVGIVALLVLLGHHSLDGAVEAVYPINPFVVLLIAQVVIIRVLLKGAPWLFEAAIVVALSLLAISLTEFGAIVGVTYIAGTLLRLPGGSLRTAGAVFILYTLFVLYRFVFVTDLGSLGSVILGRGNVAFNLIAPALSFLFSDPRGARFGFVTVTKLLRGEWWSAIYLFSSIMLTGLVVAWSMHAALRRDSVPTHDWKLAALLLVTLAAGSLFGVASEKEYLTLLSLPFYALLAYRALGWAADRALAPTTQMAASVAVGVLLVALSATWSIRAAGLFYHLRASAFAYQEEWAFDTERLGRMERYQDERSQAIARRLRAQALEKPLNHPAQVVPPAVDLLLRGRACPAIC
jgi:hypothetical protein